MTEDNTMYVLNMAYQRLQNFGEDKNKKYMRELRELAQRFTSPQTLVERVQYLESQREKCVKTITQLKEQVDVERAINHRYGNRIFDLDAMINRVLEILENANFEWSSVKLAEDVLQDSLGGFPTELLDSNKNRLP